MRERHKYIMGNLIIVAGLPASGKSSFAEYASHALHIPLISKDSIKEVLFDYIGFKNHDEKTALNNASLFVMLYAACQILKEDQDIILENNFENNALDPLMTIISENKCNVISILFTGKMETLYKRYVERNCSPGRHRGHVLSDCYPETEDIKVKPKQISFSEYSRDFSARGMNNFIIGEKNITVDATDFNEVSYDRIINKIQEYL